MGAVLKRSLQHHEEIIEAGVKSFLDVGRSLMAIRDEELYRDDFDTFEAYCKKRWNFSKPRAYQLIESAVVISDLKESTIVDTKTDILPRNEGQARALADVAPDAKTRAVVWKAAAESAPKDADGKPRITASIVKKAAESIGVRKPKKNKPKPKVHESNGRQPGEDEPEPEHELPLDKSGNPVVDLPAIIKAFSAHDLFCSTEAARTVIYGNCLQIANDHIPDGKKFRHEIDLCMKSLFNVIERYRPAYVCRSCHGEGCEKCVKRGYTCYAR